MLGTGLAWIDTCCIDQNDNVELQRCVNCHSALTTIFLSDVPPSASLVQWLRALGTLEGDSSGIPRSENSPLLSE